MGQSRVLVRSANRTPLVMHREYMAMIAMTLGDSHRDTGPLSLSATIADGANAVRATRSRATGLTSVNRYERTFSMRQYDVARGKKERRREVNGKRIHGIRSFLFSRVATRTTRKVKDYCYRQSPTLRPSLCIPHVYVFTVTHTHTHTRCAPMDERIRET